MSLCVTHPLTPDDRAEMLHRALETCPNLFDDDAVVQHLHLLNISLTPISGIFDAAIDEARAAATKAARAS